MRSGVGQLSANCGETCGQVQKVVVKGYNDAMCHAQHS